MRYLLFILLMTATLPGAEPPAAEVLTVVGKASAPAHAILKDGDKFSTGGHSKSQVGLSKGFFRVGSDTGVQVVTSNHLSLEKGIMLAGSNPGRFWRPAVTVNAPGYKMQVKGTAQIAYYPGHYVKITVLEGKVQVALQSLTGEFETLEPGQMLIINPNDKRLPEPVEVDISRLAATSQLIGGALGTLSTQGLIDASAAAQGKGVDEGVLAPSPVQMLGASPEVSLAQDARYVPVNPTVAESSVFKAGNDLVNPKAVVTRATWADNVAQSSVGNITIDRTGLQTQARANIWTVLMSGSAMTPAAVYGTITADPAMFAGSPQQLRFEDDDSPLTVLAGANVSSAAGVALQFSANGLTVDQATLTAGKEGNKAGENLGLVATAAKDLTVTGSTLAGDQVSVSSSTTGSNSGAAPTVTLDGTKVTGKHGVAVGLRSVRSNINIQNSTQLAALINNLDVLANGGTIAISGAATSLSAGRTLTIDAMGDGSSGDTGVVKITDGQISAPTIRIRSFGASGDTMVIDGSKFDATQLIELFAGGASTLRFKNHVTLNASIVNISGSTVAVDPCGTVVITGAGTVFADGRQFNGGGNVSAGYGSISASKGLILKSYSKAPPF